MAPVASQEPGCSGFARSKFRCSTWNTAVAFSRRPSAAALTTGTPLLSSLRGGDPWSARRTAASGRSFRVPRGTRRCGPRRRAESPSTQAGAPARVAMTVSSVPARTGLAGSPWTSPDVPGATGATDRPAGRPADVPRGTPLHLPLLSGSDPGCSTWNPAAPAAAEAIATRGVPRGTRSAAGNRPLDQRGEQRPEIGPLGGGRHR